MEHFVETHAPRIFVFAGVLAIIIACFTAYFPAIKASFIWDDDKYVTDNPLLTAPEGLYRIWFSTDSPSQYFPLTYTSFWVDHKLWTFNPAGYHTVNIAIHIINVLLLWLVLKRLSIPGAWFASAFFALHPVGVESVAWITERKNLLMLFFSLLTILCWIEFALGNRTARKAFFFYIGSLFFFALALLSKTTACTLPAAFVLILWLKRSSLTLKRWIQIVPFVMMAIGMGLLAVWWEKYHQGTEQVYLGFGLAGKLLLAGRALWFYLWKLFWPVNLTFSYPRWNIKTNDIWQYAWPAGYALMLLCLWFWRKNNLGRAALTAVTFFAAMLFPMLGFFSLYTFVYSFVADHYQYAACIGPIALVSAGGAYFYRRLPKIQRAVFFSAAGAILFTLGILTWRQSRIYLNPETLWQDTLAKNPNSWMANNQMGRILYKQGRYEDALIYFKRRLALSSYTKVVNPSSWASGCLGMGLILETQGRLNDAVDYYLESLKFFENNPTCHFHLGEILAKQGKFEEAIWHFRRATDIKPNYYTAYLDWGTALLFLARTKEAMESEKLLSDACEKYKKATALRPYLYNGYIGWGSTLLVWAKKKGNDEKFLKEAIAMLMKAEKLKRGSAAYNLACIWCILKDENQCRIWLKVGEEEKTLPERQAAIADPDLKAIRDKEWFGRIRWDGE